MYCHVMDLCVFSPGVLCSQPADAALGLLWKYYERTQNFAAAAQVLGQLAERRPGYVLSKNAVLNAAVH